MITNLVISAILLVFNCGPFVFQENRRFKEKLAHLQNALVDDAKTFGYESHLSEHGLDFKKNYDKSHNPHKGMAVRAEVHTNFGVDYATYKKYREMIKKERQMVRNAEGHNGHRRVNSFGQGKAMPSLLKHSSEMLPALSEHGNNRYKPLPMSSLAGEKYKPGQKPKNKARKNTADTNQVYTQPKKVKPVDRSPNFSSKDENDLYYDEEEEIPMFKSNSKNGSPPIINRSTDKSGPI